ncbi:hypothetical protein SteCoe_4473 [Stentor coeruleus]|uniref:Myotubularin phosphatase domain-containing protein n=1 Tax=Stentor coeruleus TaxID=5963 RepID=A0A1R2CUT3_9CILI|nr:hypothetical protein SteCoe_4473 [Stentor coeruleus]
MDINIRIPILKDFSIERVIAQTNIKSDEVGNLSLNKDQLAQVIGKIDNWVWCIDETSNEGWLPKSSLKLSTIIIPHLGANIDFRITLTIKNQSQRFNFQQDLENFISNDIGIFTQIDWTDTLHIVFEASHRVISTKKILLEDFKAKKYIKCLLELTNFKRSSAVIIIEANDTEGKTQYLEENDEKSDGKLNPKLISGEILRYTCNAYGGCGNVYQNGRLSITNYRFLFTSSSKYDYVLSVPHYAIDNFSVNIGQITITSKDLRVIDYYVSQDVMAYVLDKYSELDGMHFCFDYYLAFYTSSDYGWSIYEPEREFTRMGAFDSGNWKKVDVNYDYKFCESYPAVLLQPSYITDDELRIIANFRSRRRIPTVTWVGKNSTLFRSSQPCVGVFYSRCKEDEDYMSKTQIKYIIDARPKLSARANKVRGKGFEHSAYYARCKMLFMNIPNIHKIKSSYEALKNITSKDDFLLLLHNSKWLNRLKSILSSAKAVADFLIYEKSSVLIHCSDGWDRTSQISALAQILIDPFYRTFHGFQVLICKDWISFGHKFKDRGSCTSDNSPIFIQFLDAVYQILRQNTSEFQFTNYYLLFLAEAVYSGKYGTFMGNSEKDLKEFSDKTLSVWKEEDSEFFNIGYKTSNLEILSVKTQISSLVFWDYFYKWNVN